MDRIPGIGQTGYGDTSTAGPADENGAQRASPQGRTGGGLPPLSGMLSPSRMGSLAVPPPPDSPRPTREPIEPLASLAGRSPSPDFGAFAVPPPPPDGQYDSGEEPISDQGLASGMLAPVESGAAEAPNGYSVHEKHAIKKAIVYFDRSEKVFSVDSELAAAREAGESWSKINELKDALSVARNEASEAGKRLKNAAKELPDPSRLPFRITGEAMSRGNGIEVLVPNLKACLERMPAKPLPDNVSGNRQVHDGGGPDASRVTSTDENFELFQPGGFGMPPQPLDTPGAGGTVYPVGVAGQTLESTEQLLEQFLSQSPQAVLDPQNLEDYMDVSEPNSNDAQEARTLIDQLRSE